jgi:hypothetical protein
MSHRKRAPEAPPTPEQIKALIDAQDWAWQGRLCQLLVSDPNSAVGRNVAALFNHFQVRIDRLEELAGIAADQVDPKGVLEINPGSGKSETLKVAKKRLGLPSTGAVKQLRDRAKKRKAQTLARVKHTTPVVSTQGGRVVEVTEQP